MTPDPSTFSAIVIDKTADHTAPFDAEHAVLLFNALTKTLESHLESGTSTATVMRVISTLRIQVLINSFLEFAASKTPAERNDIDILGTLEKRLNGLNEFDFENMPRMLSDILKQLTLDAKAKAAKPS